MAYEDINRSELMLPTSDGVKKTYVETSADQVVMKSGRKLEEVALDDAISPDDFEGSDYQKVQAAVGALREGRNVIKFSRIYDITGHTIDLAPYTPDVSYPVTLLGVGGGIKKTDSGFIFSRSGNYRYNIRSSNMYYRSNAGAGTTVFDGSKFFRFSSYNDAFYRVDSIITNKGYLLQSVHIRNASCIGGSSYAIEAKNFFDVVIESSSFELREGVIKNTEGTIVHSRNNHALRIKDNMMQSIVNTAIVLGSCEQTVIDGNYMEYNGGYLNMGMRSNEHNHKALTVSNNHFVLRSEQVSNKLYSIRWGLIDTNHSSIGNNTNGLLHSVEAKTMNSRVHSSCDKSSSGEIGGTKNSVVVQELSRTVGAEVNVKTFGPVVQMYQKPRSVSLSPGEETSISFLLPIELPDSYSFTLQATPAISLSSREIAQDRKSVTLTVKNTSSVAVTQNVSSTFMFIDIQ